MKQTGVLLVGVGGYGAGCAHEMLGPHKREGVYLAGAVDPFAKASSEYARLAESGAPIYDTLEQFFQNHTADLAVISTPIHFHERQAVACLEHGANVLLEKPIAGDGDAARRIIEARDKAGLKLGVGFQWCYDETMRRMKAEANAGLYGRLLSMRALVIWPRSHAYYARGSHWAGKAYASDGAPIFDSVASNATAHYLENMLWLAGEGAEEVKAETRRAYDIETYDTIALRARLKSGARLFYAASHAAGEAHRQNPMFEYAFENATVRFGGRGQTGDRVAVTFKNGETRDLGPVMPDGTNLNKLWTMVDAVRGQGGVACTAEDALLHISLLDAVRAACPRATPFPQADVREDNDFLWVPGLADTLQRCYEEEKLPGER